MKLQPAIFVDRDGTLNQMVYDETHGLLDSPRMPAQTHLIPGAAAFVAGVHKAGFQVIVVTNQPGIAKGTLTEENLKAVNKRLQDLLASEGAAWDALYYCPHHPEGGAGGDPRFKKVCSCRKPKPGMLLDAARDHHIDLSKSWMVGDGFNDIQAGKSAGCKTILVGPVKVEHIQRFFSMENCMPDAVVGHLAEALRIILSKPA